MMRKDLQLICGARQPCGFRALAEYFILKQRFMAGVCPRCGGPVQVVVAYTETPAPWRIETDPGSREYRSLVPVGG